MKINRTTTKEKLSKVLVIFETILLGETQASVALKHDMAAGSIVWECKKVLEMIVISSIADPHLPAPELRVFSWRALRKNASYWQAQLAYMRKYFGIEQPHITVSIDTFASSMTLRNVDIMERVIKGEKCGQIAKDMKLTYTTVLLIYKRMIKQCREVVLAQGIAAPSLPTLYGVRRHSAMWLQYSAVFRKSL